MRVPAALHRWAAEHNQQLSAATRSEVDVIASVIDASPLHDREVEALGPDFADQIRALFQPDRAERAINLIEIVADWAMGLPADLPRAVVAEISGRGPTAAGEMAAREPDSSPPPDDRLSAPAFLRSDRVEQDDHDRMFGTARSYARIVLAAVSVLALIAVGIGVWLWASGRAGDTVTANETDADAVTTTGAGADASTDEAADGSGSSDASDGSTVDSEAQPATPSGGDTTEPAEVTAWADTTTILNSGTSEILGSTYAVSVANRAVLTGHRDAITGIVVSDEGRVLTSGADGRLVDWGSEVTLASPDIVDLASPLTVLSRTADQRLMVGDAAGSVTVIDLVSTAEPVVIPVHGAAISAIVEIGDGRVVIASVDGDVALFDLSDPGDRLELPHTTEVTAAVALDGGTIATASVDGIVRVWSPGAPSPVATISTFDVPVTALHPLADGRLATASVDGRVHVVPTTDGAQPDLTIEAGRGAIRALFVFDDLRHGTTIATGGDDATIRLFSADTGALWRRLDGHGDLVSAIGALPDGRLVSTSADGTGRVWDLDLAPGPAVASPHEWNLSEIQAWNNDQLVTAGVDGRVMLVSTVAPTAPRLLTDHPAPVVGLAVMPNADIVSLDSAGVLRLTQAGPGAAEPYEIQAAPGATALDAVGELGAVTGHADGTVRFTDFTAEVAAVEAHAGGVTAVLGLSDGRVLSAGDDMRLVLTSLTTAQAGGDLDGEDPSEPIVFDHHTSVVTALTQLPDGRVASAGVDGIYVFDVDSPDAAPVHLTGHRSTALSLVALRDGRILSSATDGQVRLWSVLDADTEAVTVVDVPGVVNPHLALADNGLFVAGAGRGYVVFTID